MSSKIRKEYRKFTVNIPKIDGNKVDVLAKKTGLSGNAYIKTLIYKDLGEKPLKKEKA